MNIELLIIILFLASIALITGIAYLTEIVRSQFQAIKAFQFRAKTPVLKSTAQPPAYTALLADDHKPPAYSAAQEPSNERAALLAAIKAHKTLTPSSEEVVSQPITTLDPQWAAVNKRIPQDYSSESDWSDGEDSDVPEDTHTPPAELEDSGNAGSTSEDSRPVSPVLSEEQKLQAAAEKVAHENAQRDIGIALQSQLQKRKKAAYGSSSESSSDGWSLSDNSGDEGHGGGKSRKKHFRSKAKLDSLHLTPGLAANQQPN
jgi:Tfp pilus assembly protein PilE